jgi:hypothetical protein
MRLLTLGDVGLASGLRDDVLGGGGGGTFLPFTPRTKSSVLRSGTGGFVDNGGRGGDSSVSLPEGYE